MPVPGPRAIAALTTLLAVLLAPAVALGQGDRRPLPEPKPPPTFLLRPTDQLAVPGQPAGTLVTPEGDLFTGWAELTFNVGGLRTFDPRTHSLQEGRYPIVHMFRTVDGVLYELDAFQASVRGRGVVFARVQATNLGTRRRGARIAAGVRYDGGEFGPRNTRCCIRIDRFPRPRTPARDGLYWQPGAGFSAAWTYSLANGALLRDGQALLLYPPGGPGLRVSQSLGGGSPVTTRTEFGRTIYDMSLRPRERRAVVFRMPVEPVAPADPVFAEIAAARFDQYRGIVRSYWRSLLGQAMRVRLPERKVVDTFYASIVNDALSRYQLPSNGTWVQTVNKLRYHAFWLRDSSIITNMYDLVGLHRLARENLDFFRTWQRDDGLFISRIDEFDGFGQTLWVFGEHFRRTGNAAYAQEFLPVVRRAMDWFESQRANDPLGLMPPVQTPLDNELVQGHLAGDNFWAVAGVAAAIDLARGAGDGASADRWQRTYDDFLSKVRGNVFNAQRANRGAIPPSLDVRGGQDWGNLWAAYPHVVLPPESRVVSRTLARVRRKFREGIATYADTSLLHHYLGFRVFQTELLRNEQRKVVEGLYDELAHTSGSGAGFEAGAQPYGDRVVDDTTVPHGWFAAEYVALVRNMLVREEGSDIRLMSAVSPSWLRPGKRIEVAGAPTRRGRVSFSFTATRGGGVLRWSTTGLTPGTRLRWPVPYAARGVSVRGLNRRTGLISLPGRAGRLAVRWRLVGEDPTFARRFNRLMRLYFTSTSGAVEAAAARRRGALPGPLSK